MCGAWVNCHFPNQTCLKCFWDPDEWDLPWVHFFVMSSVVKLSELWYVNIRAIRKIARNGINKMKFFGLSLAPVREVPPTSSPFSRGCRERPCQLWWVVKACKSLVTRTGMGLVTTTAWVWPQGPTWGWSQRPQEVGREDRMDIYHSPALHSNMKTYPKYVSGAQRTIMLQNLNACIEETRSIVVMQKGVCDSLCERMMCLICNPSMKIFRRKVLTRFF